MAEALSQDQLGQLMVAHLGGHLEQWRIRPIKTGKFNQSYNEVCR